MKKNNETQIILLIEQLNVSRRFTFNLLLEQTRLSMLRDDEKKYADAILFAMDSLKDELTLITLNIDTLSKLTNQEGF